MFLLWLITCVVDCLNFPNWRVSFVFTISLEFIKELLFWNSHQTPWKAWAVLDLQVCPYLRASHAINAQQTSVQLSWIIWLYTKRAASLVCVTASQHVPAPSIALHSWLDCLPSSLWTHLQAKVITYCCMQSQFCKKISSLSFSIALITSGDVSHRKRAE